MGTGLITHATASVVLARYADRGWEVGLVEHPLFSKMMTPGGHVEPGEQPHEAALREAAEETGWQVHLVPPVPDLCHDPSRLIAAPWWIHKVPMPGDTALADPHTHLDHIYVALAGRSAGPAELPLHWYTVDELPVDSMLAYSIPLARYVLSGRVLQRLSRLLESGQLTAPETRADGSAARPEPR